MYRRKNMFLPTRFFLNLFRSACQSGYFGQHCLERCKETCTGCNNVNGSCDFSCLPGWKGHYCQEGLVGCFLYLFYLILN